MNTQLGHSFRDAEHRERYLKCTPHIAHRETTFRRGPGATARSASGGGDEGNGLIADDISPDSCGSAGVAGAGKYFTGRAERSGSSEAVKASAELALPPPVSNYGSGK